MGIPWVVFLAHKTDYPRFGFALNSRWALTGNYGSHAAFQFLPLTAAARGNSGGRSRHAPEFGEISGSGD